MLVTHDSFAIPKAGEGRVRAGERAEADDPAGRRRRRDGQPGAPDEGQPAGRRALRHRQQPALARARRGPVRAVHGRRASTCVDARLPARPDARGDAGRPRRRLPQRRQALVRLPRRRAAGDARRPRRSPRYRNLLVVENPATSTPGLAFLLATIARFGESGWQDYWRQLRANGVLVVDGWEEAYTARFSGAGGSKGNRPIVVSYATSPPAEVIFAKTPPKTAPTAVVTSTLLPADRVRRRARGREERRTAPRR